MAKIVGLEFLAISWDSYYNPATEAPGPGRTTSVLQKSTLGVRGVLQLQMKAQNSVPKTPKPEASSGGPKALQNPQIPPLTSPKPSQAKANYNHKLFAQALMGNRKSSWEIEGPK